MEMKFDQLGFCVYWAITMQKNLHELRGMLFNDSKLEILALWRVAPEELGSDVAPLRLSGTEATNALLEALSCSSGEGALARKRPVRFPGAIRVSSETFQVVKTVCSNKRQLRDALKGLTSLQRKEFWSKFPTWTGFEVLREPTLIEWPKSVTFYWQAGSCIIKKTAAAWQVPIRAVLDNPKNISSRYRARIVELRQRELAYLEDLDQELPIGSFRRLAPSIRGRVVNLNGKTVIYNASLPFIYCNSAVRVAIKPLKSLYDYVPPGHQRNAGHSRAKLAAKPITEGSFLYCYRS